MTMWLSIDEQMSRTAGYGEDPERPNEFLYHVPEYDAQGNLLPGHDPEYYRADRPPSSSGHGATQGSGIGLNTSLKDDGDVNETGPAQVVPDNTLMDSPASWGPSLLGPEDEQGFPVGEPGSYPYPPAEQLKKDTHWALGAGRSFQWPGGQEAAERGHNIVGKHDFTLENSGTDDEPIPSYKHMGTGARIEPSGDADAPWELHSNNYDHDNGVPFGSSLHTSPVAAAMEHTEQLKSRRPEPAYTAPSYSPSSYTPPRGSGRSRTAPRTRGPRGSRPTNVDDAMRHAVGTASYLGEDQANNSKWDLRNEGTTFGGHPSVMPTHSTGMLDHWPAEQYAQDLQSGKVQHVIYHHQTPLAWLNVEAGPSGDVSAGDAKHTWVVPDERYSNTSSRRQRAIHSSIRNTGHGDEVQEPYDPARGFPYSHGRVTGGTYMARSHAINNLVGDLGEQGFQRPAHNSRQSAVFIRPTTQTEERVSPWSDYTHTRTHGVYMRPVDGPSGQASWIVGEHENGTNKVTGSKRLDSLDAALNHADRMHSWIRGGSEGHPPAIADQQDAAFRRDIRRRRGLDAPLPRTPAIVLPGQQELPFHESSVTSWSDFLRED